MPSQQELAVDVVQFALDLVGIVDPSGTADAISGLISLGRGKWLDAAISGISMVPYIGDLAKTAKLPRYVKSIAESIKLASKDHKFASQLKPALEKLNAALDKVPLGNLPASAQSQIRQVKSDIEAFLRRRMYGPDHKFCDTFTYNRIGQKRSTGNRYLAGVLDLSTSPSTFHS